MTKIVHFVQFYHIYLIVYQPTLNEKNKSNMHFVILEHQTPDGIHWDLMLENQDKLWTWRLDIHPAKLQLPVTAERIFDHPRRFLSYEGPVQNGTANVRRVDEGDLCYRQITSETILCQLDGKILNGVYDLHLEQIPLWTLNQA